MIWLISEPAGRTRSNSMAQFFDPFQPLAPASDAYNEIVGSTLRTTYRPERERRMDWLTDTNGKHLFSATMTRWLFYTTGTDVDASTD